MKALGASPTPIPWPELFTSFQTGVVEGSKNGITDIMGMKFPDAGLQYVTLDGHAYMGALWWMNNEKFLSMPEDMRRVVVDGFVALYVRDDSIDLDEGYNGTISNAIVIQQADDGDHCIEADGIGSYSGYPDTPEGEAAKQALIAAGLNSRPTINNLTCIISANDSGTHSDGSGLRLREGIWPTINNLVVVSSFAPNEDASNGNYCLRIDSSETQDAAVAGNLSLNGAIFACQVPARGN